MMRLGESHHDLMALFADPAGIGPFGRRYLERFPAKWIPVRVKKTRQNKEIEPPFRFNRNGKGSRELMEFARGREFPPFLRSSTPEMKNPA
jgi:hypothetical protein